MKKETSGATKLVKAIVSIFVLSACCFVIFQLIRPFIEINKRKNGTEETLFLKITDIETKAGMPLGEFDSVNDALKISLNNDDWLVFSHNVTVVSNNLLGWKRASLFHARYSFDKKRGGGVWTGHPIRANEGTPQNGTFKMVRINGSTTEFVEYDQNGEFIKKSLFEVSVK